MRKKKIVIAALTLMAVMFFGTLAGFLNFAPKNNSLNSNPEQAQEIIKNLLAPVSVNASALGNERSNLTIVEFGDYQCPNCAQFHKETKDTLIENFVDTGKVKFIFKDFIVNDLPSDRASTLAAEASYCAAEQGRYWDYHDELYRNSKGENTGWVTKDNLKQFANNIMVPDLIKFSGCVESHKYSSLVTENDNLARTIGLTGTPTFILYNGTTPIAIQGAYPYQVFDQVIKEMT